MPYSFTKIERDKTKTIGLVFSFLILFYFLTALSVAYVIKFFFHNPKASSGVVSYAVLNGSDILLTLSIAFCLGLAHWLYSTSNLVAKLIIALNAEQLNPKDEYHQKLQNIIEEVCVATGGKNIEGVVIPTSALNAFALEDFEGRKVVGVTEGLLARLNRAQLEAVVGHEAGHILSGDCLSATVTSSLFEIYNAILKNIEMLFKGGRSGRGLSFRGGGSGVHGIYIIFVVLSVYGLLAISRFLSQMVRLLISREREFRADAIAARLTRDPLSLAEALYAMSYRWRGEGLPAQELNSIFIISPAHAAGLNEGEGFFEGFFSTHPPVWKRLEILMDMAHADAETVIDSLKSQENRPRTMVPQAKQTDEQWLTHQDGQWLGPFALMQLLEMPGLKHDSWIKKLGTNNVVPAYQDEKVRSGLDRTDDPTSDICCPRCRAVLTELHYEGVDVLRCGLCQGTLVKNNDIKRILLRKEVGFPEQVVRIAQQKEEDAKTWGGTKIDRSPESLHVCPACHNPRIKLMRMFYTAVFQVEIDKCFYCDQVWFDADELEVLQCMMERAEERKSHEHKDQ